MQDPSLGRCFSSCFFSRSSPGFNAFQSSPAPTNMSQTQNTSSNQPAYSQPKPQWSQPQQNHQVHGALPPISHVHPAQSPPIAIHHSVPAGTQIRYGY